jgi:hypothetical protein
MMSLFFRELAYPIDERERVSKVLESISFLKMVIIDRLPVGQLAK